MKEKILDTLKKCSKDEDSYLTLRHLVSSLTDEIHRSEAETEKYRNYLDLLERAILNDYDSILVTTLELEEPGPKIAYVNRGFTRMTGYEREEIIGKTPRILQGEKTDRNVLDNLKQKLESGEPFFGHAVNYRKDGTEFVNQWDIHPLPDEQGRITHWVSYQQDITERKSSEKIWNDAQMEFDDLEEDLKSTKIDLDSDGKIIRANKLFRYLVRYGVEEIGQLRFWELLDDDDRERVKKMFVPFRSADFIDGEYDLSLLSKSGEKIEVRAKTRLISNNGHTIVRIKFINRSLKNRIIGMLKKRRGQDDQVTDKA